jgi:hypothetical protein
MYYYYYYYYYCCYCYYYYYYCYNYYNCYCYYYDMSTTASTLHWYYKYYHCEYYSESETASIRGAHDSAITSRHRVWVQFGQLSQVGQHVHCPRGIFVIGEDPAKSQKVKLPHAPVTRTITPLANEHYLSLASSCSFSSYSLLNVTPSFS